jgi:hypothetical protein
MKGERGTCTAGDGKDMLRRTKYDTKIHAQEACEFHIAYGFISEDAIVYKCKVCHMYHFAKPEFAKLYSKNK